MALAMAGQRLARNDRHVRRAQLRMSADAPRHRLVFNIEEALRLCSLPGENEGRAYYFRYLYLNGLPENGDRRAWLEAFQCALLELARRAVHGVHGAARTADAVFFLHEQEARETLLALILRRHPADAWFWPAVSGTPAGASPATRVVALIDRLMYSPASWVAVAAAVFAAIERDDPSVLLSLLSDAVVSRWLNELGDEEPVPREFAPILFLGSTQKAIARAAVVAGPDDPRVLWVASLAVVLAHPSALERGAVVGHARQSLRTIAPSDPLPLRPRGKQQDAPSRPQVESGHAAISRLGSSSGEEGGPDLASLHDTVGLPKEPALVPDDPTGTTARPITEVDSRGKAARSMTKADSTSTTVASIPAPDSIAQDDTTGSEPAQRSAASLRDRCLGETTNGAGLYFLLNALRWLKAAEDPLSLRFLAYLFQRLACHARIESDDPILLWTLVTLDQTDAEEIDQRLLRIWVLKVRRWCWQNGKISVREIVRRPGLVTLTRTDLDVSLALDSADIRIRRIGLDLDPGWLPWFGRVVRFHYLYRGELHA